MEVTINLGDLTADQLAELMVEKMEEQGKVLPAPVREEPYSVKEAAEALNVSGDTIYAELKGGKLPMVPRLGAKRVPAWAIRVRQAGGDPMKELKRLEKEGYLTEEMKKTWG